jgi:hypothetical protein
MGRRVLAGLVRRRGRGWTREQWDEHLARQAGPELLARWSEAEPLRDELWRAGILFGAGDVPWTPEAMEVVVEAVRRVAACFGGDARLLLSGLVLVLEARTEPWWGPLWRLWNRKPASLAFGGYQYRGRIHLRADNVRLVAVVHEMGHYLDQKHRLSRAYRRHLRAAGLKLETNRFEDLANALAAHVLGRPLDPVRQAYVERLAWRGSRPPGEAA